MALKSLLGGLLAVLLTVVVVFNVIMPAMTIVAVILAGIVRASPAMPVVGALVVVFGVAYFFVRKR